MLARRCPARAGAVAPRIEVRRHGQARDGRARRAGRTASGRAAGRRAARGGRRESAGTVSLPTATRVAWCAHLSAVWLSLLLLTVRWQSQRRVVSEWVRCSVAGGGGAVRPAHRRAHRGYRRQPTNPPPLDLGRALIIWAHRPLDIAHTPTHATACTPAAQGRWACSPAGALFAIVLAFGVVLLVFTLLPVGTGHQPAVCRRRGGCQDAMGRAPPRSRQH
jgi:hypothetical protein